MLIIVKGKAFDVPNPYFSATNTCPLSPPYSSQSPSGPVIGVALLRTRAVMTTLGLKSRDLVRSDTYCSNNINIQVCAEKTWLMADDLHSSGPINYRARYAGAYRLSILIT